MSSFRNNKKISRLKGKKKNKIPVFLLLLSSLLLIILLSALVIWLALFKEYSAWEDRFNKVIDQNRIVLLENTQLKKSVETKLTSFSLSTKKIDFVEITDMEFVYVFAQSLNTSLPLNITFDKGYVESNKGSWDIYIKTKRKNLELPWIKLKLMKDNTESPQIYVKTMSLGNFDLIDYGVKGMIDKINNGIKDAIILVNESDFTGRVFRNIELEKEKMIIKGERY